MIELILNQHIQSLCRRQFFFSHDWFYFLIGPCIFPFQGKQFHVLTREGNNQSTATREDFHNYTIGKALIIMEEYIRDLCPATTSSFAKWIHTLMRSKIGNKSIKLLGHIRQWTADEEPEPWGHPVKWLGNFKQMIRKIQ